MNTEREETLERLRRIDEYEFEQFIAEMWERYDWDTEVTSGSNDAGVDVVAERNDPVPQKHLVQVKRWASGNKVSGPKIREYSSLQHRQNDIVDAVVVVTTSSFSRQAKDEAESLNVKLVDGPALYDITLDANADKLLAKYTESERADAGRGPDGCPETDNSVECRYCTCAFGDEQAIREHLYQAHDREELSRIDRRRVDLYASANGPD